ncbi:MAG: hypothetical protein HOG95_07595 [Rhodospirillaceae bacterium]|jgi:hypothetical protein|nr:hypothetical protein [Rhodospirillaceae bacterium]
MTYLRNSLCFLILYWLAFQFAGLVGISQHVSAFYPSPAVSITFIAIFGIRYLPVFAIGALITTPIDAPFWLNGAMDYWMQLRQFAVYGITGLILNRYFSEKIITRSTANIFFFIFVALISTLISSLLAREIFQYYKVFPKEIINNVFASFWVGDFAGLIIFGPLMVMVMGNLHRNLFKRRHLRQHRHQPASYRKWVCARGCLPAFW